MDPRTTSNRTTNRQCCGRGSAVLARATERTMRVVRVALVFTVLALSGCAMASSNGDSKSLAGVWQGFINSRAAGWAPDSGARDEYITMVIADDGTWSATKGSERWKGTVRSVTGGYEFYGIVVPSGRPVSFRLNRYGRDGLGGPGVMDHQGHRSVLVGVDLRAVTKAPDALSGNDGSQPSASPSSAPFGSPGGPPPEMRLQAP